MPVIAWQILLGLWTAELAIGDLLKASEQVTAFGACWRLVVVPARIYCACVIISLLGELS